ncbi:hypothetical protein [Acetobacteroides hydrogenigenes]|nr:hypothetical protein [Acetobacteroides hydrogenigenes]
MDAKLIRIAESAPRCSANLHQRLDAPLGSKKDISPAADRM